MTGLARLVLVTLLGSALGLPGPAGAGEPTEPRPLPPGPYPLSAPARIYWNERLVPFIEAASDEDLAFCLGLVQAHLRLAQMEIHRRAAQGRLAEVAGPPLADFDETVRVIGLSRAAAAVVQAWPEATRRWVERFVAGINFIVDRGPRPPEFETLGVAPQPWTPLDVAALGRLFGADVTWFGLAELLQARSAPDWPALWAKLLKRGGNGPVSFEAPALQPLAGLSRSGSNCLVVAPARSVSGAALLASDPHLGLSLPNVWLIVGLKSPSYHLAGLTAPGLPALLLGRNPHLAWGGTNLRAASSDLFDATGEPVTVRTEEIKVRWWLDREVEIRETPLGPLIHQAPLLQGYAGPPLALRWVGHQASDELTAALAASRARTWAEFQAAWKGYAVSGQNILAADAAGTIGHLLAVRVPERSGPPEDLVLTSPAVPSRLLGPESLPRAVNPPAGYLASTNNRPAEGGPAVGYFFSGADRLNRLDQLLAGPAKIGLADLQAFQRDVTSPAGLRLKELILDLAGAGRDAAEERLLAALRGWDGRYDVDSRGALALELLAYHLAQDYYPRRFSPAAAAALAQAQEPAEALSADLAEDRLLARAALEKALDRAAEDFSKDQTWGQVHRLELNHFLGRVPFIGRRYRFGSWPAAGSSSTLLKTAHRLSREPHRVSYGSCARFVADLADPDAAYFCLLGGQDGWVTSAHFLDQVEPWFRGEYVQVPLRLESVRRSFGRVEELRPAGGG